MGVEQTCKYNPSAGYYKATGGKMLNQFDIVQMKSRVKSWPIAVSVQADSYEWQHYTGGILTDSACGKVPNHAV